MTRHTIEASEKPLSDIFCDKYVFNIPSYQRPYAWTTEQAGELLDDISSACGDTGAESEQPPYFLGSVVLIKDPQNPEADIVDGQQRLTTLTILLAVLRDLASTTIAQSIQKRIGQTGDPLTGTSDIFRLTLRDRDAAFFRTHIQTETGTINLPNAEQYSDARARIVENAALFRERLSNISGSSRQRLATYLMQRCYLVLVAASDRDSAFRIFSVLNSRGLDLSPADILKSEIIGALPAADQDEYTAIWEDLEDQLGRTRFSDLFGHIRMIHRKQKLQSTLLAEFRAFVQTTADPARFIHSELRPYAEAFQNVAHANFQSFRNAEAINRQLVYLSRLDNVDWQPPAIEAIARNQGDPDLILRLLIDLERLAYGLFLLRQGPTERIRRYGRVLASMQSDDDTFAENSPLQLDETEREGILKVLAGDIYTNKRMRLPLLLRLDELLSGGSATYAHRFNTVEHVLPQSPAPGGQWFADFPSQDVRDLWVHKLANLVLLTQAKNSQASNREFSDKKSKYFMSKGGVANFAITSQVLAEPIWTPEVLHRRQESLIGALSTMWRLN